MRPNEGRLPPEAVGKTVRVELFNGSIHEWPADGRGGCCWAIQPESRPSHQFDIRFYEVIS